MTHLWKVEIVISEQNEMTSSMFFQITLKLINEIKPSSILIYTAGILQQQSRYSVYKIITNKFPMLNIDKKMQHLNHAQTTRNVCWLFVKSFMSLNNKLLYKVLIKPVN